MAAPKATSSRSGGGRTTPKGTRSTPAKRTAPDKNMLELLTAEALRTFQLPTDIVDIPELGGSVKVQAFDGARAVAARQYAVKADGSLDEDKYEVALIAIGMIEPALPKVGEEKFPFTEAEQIYFGQLSSVGRRIAMAVMSLNAGGKAAQISKA